MTVLFLRYMVEVERGPAVRSIFVIKIALSCHAIKSLARSVLGHKHCNFLLKFQTSVYVCACTRASMQFMGCNNVSVNLTTARMTGEFSHCELNT